MVTIWFESHSTTTDNEAGIASGWDDVDLSELGKKQSLELVNRCKERNLEVILCSDLQRAVKSAVPTSNALHIPIYVDERLRECDYGDFTHKPKDEIAKQKLRRIKIAFPNGESYEQVAERMKDFLEWLKLNFDSKTVLIIGHRGTHYGLDYWIKNKTLTECVSEDFVWQPGWKYELK